MSNTITAKLIKALPEKVYNAFVNPAALEIWLAPGGMTAKLHNFNLCIGGGYEMSLFYPGEDSENEGKTNEREDRYTAKFITLIPGKKIVEAINFNTANPAFLGEMMMEVVFDKLDDGTMVTMKFSNIPPGINPADNEKGTELSLQKLAGFIEQGNAPVSAC
ncbi:MAG TPA: SRPBCC domain-containing protein [Chitinophagaceae bacterium]|nr:SRPBCC domain-containing protein [Chitinophagaceae bacterium]